MGQPVIVDTGQLRNRSTHEEDAREPAHLIAEAITLALAETGADSAVRAAVDSIDVVNVVSWLYDDLPGLLARQMLSLTAAFARLSEVVVVTGGNVTIMRSTSASLS